jgi:glycosyltransferase involved in cell wall biosynthesis
MNHRIQNPIIKVCNVDEEGRFGGPERRIIQIAKALDEFGVETVVLFPRLDSDVFARKISDAGIRGVLWPLTRLTRERRILIRYAFRFWFEILSMIFFFRKHRVDLVHVNGSYQFKVAMAAKMAGVPVVWHLNDTFAPGLLKKAFHLIAPWCADGFIIAGLRVGDYYLEGTPLAERPVMEIHAPVDMTAFDPSRYRSSAGGQEKKSLTIGTVSGVNPAKGLEYFIDTAEEVLRQYPDVRFLVAGAVLGSQKQYYEMLREKLAKLDTEKIVFCGLVDDVPGFLATLDICVFSSVTEASPTSIWEAMAMAKPVVTTDVGSVNQHIRNGVSGYIVPVRDSAALAQRIGHLIDNPEKRITLGKEARRDALKSLDTKSAARKHSEIYRKILRKTY